jgi:glycosyltransferase involved in cell wall biosynthesis
VNLRGAVAPPSICFFGTYNRQHTVSGILRSACREAGVEVVECHRPLWEETRDKMRDYFGGWSLAKLGLRYLGAALSLAREWRRWGHAAPAALIGFNGQLDVLLLRWLSGRRYPIILAPLVTITETLVDDRCLFHPNSAPAKLARWLDRWTLQTASLILIDTEAHRQYLIDRFAVDPGRVATWHLGADLEAFPPRPVAGGSTSSCTVLFYGQFLPLHGVDVIVRAAHLLRDVPQIRFRLIGTGPERACTMVFAEKHCPHTVSFVDWVHYRQLAAELATCDLALGIFGTSEKARMVIPNKVYQAASVGCAIITEDSPAVREVFRDNETLRLTQAGDARALAATIRELAGDVAQRRRLAECAQTLMRERFHPARQGELLGAILARAIAPVPV